MKLASFTLTIVAGIGTPNVRKIVVQFAGAITPAIQPGDKDLVATALWQIEQIVNSDPNNPHRLHLSGQ